MLGDHLALAVQDRATGVLGLADDRRVAGAEKRVLHLLDDAGEAGLDDLQSDGINIRHRSSTLGTLPLRAEDRRLKIEDRKSPSSILDPPSSITRLPAQRARLDFIDHEVGSHGLNVHA